MTAAKSRKVITKRTQDQEEIFRRYGRNAAGHPVPQIVVVRGGRAKREVEYLVKRLRGELDLRQEDRERIADAIESGLAGRSFDQAFRLVKPANRPTLQRAFFQAAEYLLRLKLEERPAAALEAVATRWSVDKTSVRAAVTKYRSIATKWIALGVAEHNRTHAANSPQVSDEATAFRTLILLVDHEIGPDDAQMVATTR